MNSEIGIELRVSECVRATATLLLNKSESHMPTLLCRIIEGKCVKFLYYGFDLIGNTNLLAHATLCLYDLEDY